MHSLVAEVSSTMPFIPNNYRMVMRSLLTVAALAFPLLASASSLGNLVVNGSFEANSLSDGAWRVFAGASNNGTTSTTLVNGWALIAGSGIELRNNVVGAAQQGLNYVELDSHGNSAMRQSFDLLGGERLGLSFWYAPRLGQAAATNGLDVFWNGVSLTQGGITGSGVGQSQHDWRRYDFQMTARQGWNQLDFASIGVSDSLGGSLDNVSLRLASERLNSQVPEPAALALMVAALSAAGWARRQYRQR
jgi:PEP-CTERM motif